MGDIYHATDATLGRAVAVKVLADRFAQDESVRSRFTREALAAARLSSDPNTVTIFDVGEWNGHPFIVMEYLPGGSLEETLRREGAQPPARVLAWLAQAATALDGAHRAGIVHRDVKPANLMLDAEGNVHVGDFGIASAAGLDSFTAPGTVLGTAGYLAPEQARGERATPATDRYALGVVAFELLSGARPFERESATAEAAAHVNAPVPSISALRPDLPRELDAVFARALAKDPAARHRSAAELVAALRAALAAAAGTTQVYEPVRRRWPLALLATIVLAGAGIGLALALAARDDEPEAARDTTAPGVRTVVQTQPGTTVEVTVTEEPPPPQPPPPPAEPPPPPAEPPPPPAEPPPPPAGGESGAALNDQGFRLMQAGDYEAALPLLERAVESLSGSGELAEAYALYNLAATRAALGSCDGVEDLLARSEAIQGHRGEFDELRETCGGR